MYLEGKKTLRYSSLLYFFFIISILSFDSWINVLIPIILVHQMGGSNVWISDGENFNFLIQFVIISHGIAL